MVETSRKQKEIQQREVDILAVARRMLLDSGYELLSMDKLAAELRTAKGTIYNHFSNKEEIVLRLVCQALQVRHELFRIAAVAFAESRLRMMACSAASHLYVQEYREYFAIEQLVSNSTIRGKAKEESCRIVRDFEKQCMLSVSCIVRDAIAVGDFMLPPTMSAPEFIYGFWSINFGSHVLNHQRPGFGELGISDPAETIRQHCCCMLNGYNWRPIMSLQESSFIFAEIKDRLESIFAQNEFDCPS